MIVFLDTNVIIDFYAQREDFYRPAALIIDLAQRKEIEIAVSSTSFVNAFYILRKKYDKESLYCYMKGLADLCHITPVDRSVVGKALEVRWDDFEDCTQALSAVEIQADVIVTRNVADFQSSTIKVMTPSDFLNDYFLNNNFE